MPPTGIFEKKTFYSLENKLHIKMHALQTRCDHMRRNKKKSVRLFCSSTKLWSQASCRAVLISLPIECEHNAQIVVHERVSCHTNSTQKHECKNVKATKCDVCLKALPKRYLKTLLRKSPVHAKGGSHNNIPIEDAENAVFRVMVQWVMGSSKLNILAVSEKYFHPLLSNSTPSNILLIIQTHICKLVSLNHSCKNGHVQMQTHNLRFLWMVVAASRCRMRNPCGCAISTRETKVSFPD